MNAWKNYSNATDATEVVALAVRLHGRSRGWSMAASLLGVSERTARALTYGETTGATIPPETVMQARATLRRQRAAQLRSELRDLEIALANDVADQTGAHVGMGR